MAILNSNQRIEILKQPKNESGIAQGIKQNERLNFHCEPVQELDSLSTYKDKYFSWIDTILDKTKALRFRQMINMPLPTIEFMESVYDELSKMYDSQDKVFKIEMIDSELNDDSNKYLSAIKHHQDWREKSFEHFKSKINCFIVIDMPSSQNNELYPKPYWYFLPIDKVHDVVINKNDEVEYISYEIPVKSSNIEEKRIAIIDDQSYYVYLKYKDQDGWVEEINSPHSTYDEVTGELIEGLGYCPVTTLIKQSIRNSANTNKKGPATNSLGNLDWLLFWEISKKYLDSYGSWPIIVSYKQKCNYRNNYAECTDGVLRYEKDGMPYAEPCPKCSSPSLIGPGSRFEVDAPASKDEVDLLASDVIKFIEVSNDKLEYCVKELDRLKNELFINMVGFDGDILQKEAINEDQVSSQFESRETVLRRWAIQIAEAEKFVIDTIMKLRYGAYFTNSIIDYGSIFYIKKVEDLMNDYEHAKKTGMPLYTLKQLRDQINRTRYKNNPELYQRNFILENLEPYPDYTINELKNLGINESDPDNFVLKLNFNNFISRFENENTNIIEFGKAIDFNQKINIIKSKLLSYVIRPNTQSEA